ncbi:o-succinylbenzoate synthase [Tropheryma whipplei]|uniref:o-succinylbenzoate synthase n=1 Tax=Tropheryma whipplei TaxID=2039 RepID=UPI000570ECB5|nr:o-succinylbenzoate synthase [Tropheryma whipplei]
MYGRHTISIILREIFRLMDYPSIDTLLESAHIVTLPMKYPFMGLSERQAVLFEGPNSWAEYSPFMGCNDTRMWLASAIEYGWGNTNVLSVPNLDLDNTNFASRSKYGYIANPQTSNKDHSDNKRFYTQTKNHREIPVNAILPDIPASKMSEILGKDLQGCKCVKIKVGKHFQDRDIHRIRAVLDFMGADTMLRLDANCKWNVSETLNNLDVLEDNDLLENVSYIEQPCRTTRELITLKQKMDTRGYVTKIAIDESLRDLLLHWQKNRKWSNNSGITYTTELRETLSACDMLVLKLQPMGGMRAVADLLESIKNNIKVNVGYTVSSSLETSLGIEMGLALALNLPHITLPVGLATAGLLDADITDNPLLPNKGYITPRKIEVNKKLLNRYAADKRHVVWWHRRIRAAHRALFQDLSD